MVAACRDGVDALSLLVRPCTEAVFGPKLPTGLTGVEWRALVQVLPPPSLAVASRASE